LVLGLALVGCDQRIASPEVGPKQAVNLQISDASELEPQKARFKVESHGVFYAGYDNNKREIVIVHDLSTGQDYLGITGVGITELRHVQVGKTTLTREP